MVDLIDDAGEAASAGRLCVDLYPGRRPPGALDCAEGDADGRGIGQPAAAPGKMTMTDDRQGALIRAAIIAAILAVSALLGCANSYGVIVFEPGACTIDPPSCR